MDKINKTSLTLTYTILLVDLVIEGSFVSFSVIGRALCYVRLVYLSINVLVCIFLSGDGFIVFSDFVKTLEDYKRPDDQNDLIIAFRVFDPENKGFVEAKELKKALLRLKGIAEEEIEDVLEAANLEDHRHIYFEG